MSDSWITFGAGAAVGVVAGAAVATYLSRIADGKRIEARTAQVCCVCCRLSHCYHCMSELCPCCEVASCFLTHALSGVQRKKTPSLPTPHHIQEIAKSMRTHEVPCAANYSVVARCALEWMFHCVSPKFQLLTALSLHGAHSLHLACGLWDDTTPTHDDSCRETERRPHGTLERASSSLRCMHSTRGFTTTLGTR